MAQWSLTSESRRAGGACSIERRLEPIDHLVAGLSGLEQAHRAFEPKHLLDAFPLLSKPDTLDQDYKGSGGVPGAHAITAHVSACRHRRRSGVRSSNRSAISTRLVGWLSLASSTYLPPSRCTWAHTARWVCMASKVRMRPLIRCGENLGLSATLLILFRPNIAMPQDDAGGNLITVSR